MNTVEKWGLFEVSLKGPSAGNPFTEQSVSATFRSKNEIVTVDGFYDGDGVYKVRFMPSFMAITSMRRSAASRKRSPQAISP